MSLAAPNGVRVATASCLHADSPNSWRRLVYAVVIGPISNAGLWASAALMPSLQDQFGLSRTEAFYPYIAIMAGFLIFDQRGAYFAVFLNGIIRNAVNLILIPFLMVATRKRVLRADRTMFDV